MYDVEQPVVPFPDCCNGRCRSDGDNRDADKSEDDISIFYTLWKHIDLDEEVEVEGSMKS